MGAKWEGGKATKIRREFQARIDGGAVYVCPFCRREILPGMLWDVDHAVPRDRDASATWAMENLRPAHRRCNRRAGQRATTRKLRRRAGPLIVVSGARGPQVAQGAPEGRSGATCAICTTGRVVREGLCSACASAGSSQENVR